MHRSYIPMHPFYFQQGIIAAIWLYVSSFFHWNPVSIYWAFIASRKSKASDLFFPEYCGIDFCNFLLLGLPSTTEDSLKAVENACASVLTGAKNSIRLRSNWNHFIGYLLIILCEFQTHAISIWDHLLSDLHPPLSLVIFWRMS